ncbi:MAG TPA: prenyltransferase [Candidatus Krumholzibacteria bacterium]|nr:prenyltransferase [Candidatus Krumholzibacteria bacterium]
MMDTTTIDSKSNVGAGIWRLADPKISLASIASMTLAAGAAVRAGEVSMVWLVLTVLGILAIEVAKNASGEVVDWDSGTDAAIRSDERTPFSGGKRVIVDGLLTRAQTVRVAAVSYAIGIAIGAVIAMVREPRVWYFGVVGVACAFFYHAAPLRLSYRGWGEAAVAFSYGPLIACGTFLVQHHRIGGPVVPLSILLGVLIAAFLWVNEFPDARADAQAGKRTLVVRLGKARAARIFAILAVGPFAVLPALVATGLPGGVWLALVGLLPALNAARIVHSEPEHHARIAAAQASTLVAFLLFALGGAIGLAAWR